MNVVVWWSAGAASTIAARLTLAEYPDARLIYCDPRMEHPDNERFRADVEAWLGVEIEVHASDRYHDPVDVWERTGWIVGDGGARCTVELKKRIRQQIEADNPEIWQVFGYTIEEARPQSGKKKSRLQRFREANPEVQLLTPLVDQMLTKADCLGVLVREGIELPAMYQLGYRNANCIGCPHGGMGYWNMIRRDFPDVFDAMAERERRFNNACCRPGGEAVFLDELDPDRGDIFTDPDADCSLLCVNVP